MSNLAKILKFHFLAAKVITQGLDSMERQVADWLPDPEARARVETVARKVTESAATLTLLVKGLDPKKYPPQPRIDYSHDPEAPFAATLSDPVSGVYAQNRGGRRSPEEDAVRLIKATRRMIQYIEELVEERLRGKTPQSRVNGDPPPVGSAGQMLN